MNMVFVGNGVMKSNLSHIVNAADFVIRSQRCHYLGDLSGSKTDMLCVRPSNEPFGVETAQNKRIPENAVTTCKCLFSAYRRPHPSFELLFKNYPSLARKPRIVVSETPTRQLLEEHGARTTRRDGQLNPTMGMCLLHHFIMRELWRWIRLSCIGFAWQYGYDDHDQDTERLIQQAWAKKGFMEFVQ